LATIDDKSTATVGVLGAGLSGVAMGMALRRAGIDDFVIYERQPDVGGTWFRNTYPGLHCDIPSHLYSYLSEPNPDWSMVYSGQAEIQAYIRGCAEKHDLIGRIRFGTGVDAARFSAERGTWNLEIAGGQTAEHRVLVSATGGLTAPRMPKIDGLDRFDGPMWHSGAWRHDVDLTGLRVAVIGSAASAVQVVPEVAKHAEEVVVFSRTPNWVMPRNNRFYTDQERDGLRSHGAVRAMRRGQYREAMLWNGAFNRRQASIETLRRTALAHMRGAIDDEALIDALTPDYDPGCRRILLSDEYYPALATDHVQLIAHGVESLTEDAVVATDGTEVPVDVVIFCTGYRLGGREDGTPAVRVYGRDGRSVSEVLAEKVQAYRGIALPGFPNYFTVCGINGSVGYGSLFASAEVGAEAIASLAGRLVREDLATIEARSDVTDRYNTEIQRELETMSWTGPCTNFYLDRKGRVVSFFPGTLGRMRRELRSIDDDELLMERN